MELKEIRKALENVKVTLTKYTRVAQQQVAQTNVTPFRTSCIDNTPSTQPDFFYGVEVSGVTEVLNMVNNMHAENARLEKEVEEMRNKIIKLQTK